MPSVEAIIHGTDSITEEVTTSATVQGNSTNNSDLARPNSMDGERLPITPEREQDCLLQTESNTHKGDRITTSAAQYRENHSDMGRETDTLLQSNPSHTDERLNDGMSSSDIDNKFHSPIPIRSTSDAEPSPYKVTFFVEGMSCEACAAHICMTLQKLKGVKNAHVDFFSKKASILVEPRFTDSQEVLEKKVSAMGYNVFSMSQSLDSTSQFPLNSNTSHVASPTVTTTRASPMISIPSSIVICDEIADDANVDGNNNSTPNASFDRESNSNDSQTRKVEESLFMVEGIACGSCAARIEDRVRKIDGVQEALVNFATTTAKVLHTLSVSPTLIQETIADMGYGVHIQRTTVPFAATLTKMPGDLGRRSTREMASLRQLTEQHYFISGMSCASCAARIEATVSAMRGVTSCSVNFSMSTAVVAFNEDSLRIEVQKVIQNMGYKVHQVDDTTNTITINKTKEALERTKEISEQKFKLIGSCIFSVPLMIFMILMSFTDVLDDPARMKFMDAIQLILTTPIVFYFGRQFFVGAYRSLKHLTFTMDTLVAIGTGCSYFYSLVAFMVTLATPLSLTMYFDTAGMLTSFMLLGRYLEANAKRKTGSALIELMNLVPTTAILVEPEGDITIPSAMIKRGNLVRVRAGDRIPVDGVIIDGLTDVDEQMVTGEPIPKTMKPGMKVVGGTLNLTAMIVIEANRVGEETMLSQILRIVQEAQTTKPAIQRIADRMAMYFVPFVAGFSTLVLIVWLTIGSLHVYPKSWGDASDHWIVFAFNFFIATVVAACPCALGLATPTAIMVGTGVGARKGVLVKSGVTLEAVSTADCVVFDKTGTITNGKLEVIWHDCFNFEGNDEATLFKRLIGIVEGQSNHPIAMAVSEFLLRHPTTEAGALPLSEFEVEKSLTHSGLGMEASIVWRRTVRTSPDAEARKQVNKYHIIVGNHSLMRCRSITLPEEIMQAVAAQSSEGRTIVIGAINGVARLVVALMDQPKHEAALVVRFLQDAKLRTLMVTGDNRNAALHVAQQVGIPPEDVYAEVLPAKKAAIVHELQQTGSHVIFVGDGINDSPALAQADVGVALGAGTEIAIEAADAVLVHNSLVDLLNLRQLSITTVRRIYGNFIWAFGYNIIMLPIASGMLFPIFRFQLPPVLAGAAMVFSSLSVLTSSLSIRCFDPFRGDEIMGQIS